MLIKRYNKKGQIFTGEYVIVLTIAAAAVFSMSVYLRRGVQARLRDANNGMLDIVRAKVGTTYNGTNVWLQYEPYYANSSVITDSRLSKTKQLFGSFNLSSGIASTTYNDIVGRTTNTITAPPANAN